MSNTNEIKKINKKRKKKRNEMSLEDYAKEKNININIALQYEDDSQDNETNIQQSNYLIYQSNKISKNKNKILYNNIYRKDSELEDIIQNSNKSLNIELHKQASASTNNSSFDEENKNKNIENNIKNIIKNAINQNKNYKISSAINNAKILSEYKKDITQNNVYNFNPNIINTNVFGNINLNYNFIINNNKYNNYNYYYNKNLYDYNNLNNINNIKNYNYILTYNYYLYKDKLNNIKNEIIEVEKQVKLLENKNLSELFLLYQSTDLLNYINKKNDILIKDNNNSKLNVDDEKKETPEHPYFYINHDEEKQINNVLYIIEGLFSEDNLKKDFNLLSMLNRDGYASLRQLENHPQLKLCKITETHLKTVFSEHRGNEITETVETFDDILIRNKKWIKIKKEINDIEKVKEQSINSIKDKKDFQMKKLLEKKQNYLSTQKELLYKYQINNINIRQKLNQIQYNNIIYNNNFNNNINFNYNNLFNNNNFNNIYNNNNSLTNNNIYNNNLYNIY